MLNLSIPENIRRRRVCGGDVAMSGVRIPSDGYDEDVLRIWSSVEGNIDISVLERSWDIS
jgi:hypothetical protein